MNRKLRRLAFVAGLTIALVLVAGGEAQPPTPKGPPFGKKGGRFSRPVTTDQIVERLLSFDKNNDQKITSDELPERMQHLIALGDLNKDGALDREEIRKLATTLEAFAALTGTNGPGAVGPPPGAPPKGPGPKGGPRGGGEVQRTLDELNLSGGARDKAQAVARSHQDKLRRFEDLARAEVILLMKDALNEEDYRIFKSALERRPAPKGFGGPKQADLHRRIEQLQQELDELRRKLPK
jgi:hypothetical protein